MKSLSFILPVLLFMSVSAQQNASTTQYINEDGKNLSIKITGTVNGHTIDYDRVFDVSGMNDQQKKNLKQHVYDSLGLSFPVAPRQPMRPHAPVITATPAAPVEPTTPAELSLATNSSTGQSTDLYAMGGAQPYTKEIRYNPANNILHLKYRFIKNGEETTVEKSVDTKGKSKEAREQIIKNYEKEIGLLQQDQQ